MSSAIFTNGNTAYQVANIIYAGSVTEIPEARRRNGSTHSFRIITGVGQVYSHYKDEETARKSRGFLSSMLDTIKTNAFKHGLEFVDPSRIVSFSNVVQFKKPLGAYTHGFVVLLDTVEEKFREVWFRYKSEDHAQKGRKALWAAVHGVNGMSAPRDKTPSAEQPVSNGLPF
jgi:hypothetical protein